MRQTFSYNQQAKRQQMYKKMLTNQMRLNLKYKQQLSQIVNRNHILSSAGQSYGDGKHKQVQNQLNYRRQQRNEPRHSYLSIFQDRGNSFPSAFSNKDSSYLSVLQDKNIPIQSQSRFIQVPFKNKTNKIEKTSPIKQFQMRESDNEYQQGCLQVINELKNINQRSLKYLKQIQNKNRYRIRNQPKAFKSLIKNKNQFSTADSFQQSFLAKKIPSKQQINSINYKIKNKTQPIQHYQKSSSIVHNSFEAEKLPNINDKKIIKQNELHIEKTKINPQIKSDKKKIAIKSQPSENAIKMYREQQKIQKINNFQMLQIRGRREKFLQQLRKANNRGQTLQIKLSFLKKHKK